jgi:urease accessory protein
METFHGIVGHHSDEAIHDRLHALDAQGRVARIAVSKASMGRRRFRAFDSNGVEYGIALARTDLLRDGSVLFIDDERAVVIEGDDGETLDVRALTTQGAIQLGWHAGHLHWRVRFGADDIMTVLLDGPRDDYEARIREWLDNGSMEIVG